MEDNKLKDLLNRTGVLIKQRKELEDKENGLKKEVQAELEKMDLSSLSSSLVTVSKVTKKSYTYSTETQRMEKELKLKKNQEEMYGEAEVTMKSHYMFVLNKEFVKDEYNNFGDVILH
jgi:hypothetical protein